MRNFWEKNKLGQFLERVAYSQQPVLLRDEDGSAGASFCDSISSVLLAASGFSVTGGEEDASQDSVSVLKIPEIFFTMLILLPRPPLRFRNDDMKDDILLENPLLKLLVATSGLLLMFSARRCCCSAQVRTLTNALYHDTVLPLRRSPFVFAAFTLG